jgi:hypothetical protein
MISFKQFLAEGGKATEKFGTSRATKADIEVALKYISRSTGIKLNDLISSLLGSSRLTFNGTQEDSGDIDVAVHDSKEIRAQVIADLTTKTGNKPYVIGGNTYSFAVPVSADRKVQVDVMFVPDIEWAKFSHHAADGSAHKSGVRNELLHSALKFSMQDGADVRIQDGEGNDIARASRSYKLDQGVERIFKVSKNKKNGEGRLKGMSKATPKEVQATLDQLGNTQKFSAEADIIRDPDAFAGILFGSKVKGTDILSAEQLIKLIKKYKPAEAAAIFKDAVQGIKNRNFKVPVELAQYE